jgi:hypothetical protein
MLKKILFLRVTLLVAGCTSKGSWNFKTDY